MKSTYLPAGVAAAALCLACGARTDDNAQSAALVTEIAVFRVRDGVDQNAVAEARRKMRLVVKEAPGFVSWRPLASASAKNVYVDVLAWDNLADARAAFDRVKDKPESQAYMALIEEVLYFEHFTDSMDFAGLNQ